MGVLILTMRKQRSTIDPKVKALQEQGALNHHPECVKDPLFMEKEFFDARDVVQVKYEMVRRVEAEGQSVTAASAAFGFSRPSFYQAQSILRQDGLPGLIPKKRGPRSGHKLREDVVDFIESARAADRSLSISDLASEVVKRFGVEVHRRTIERALRRREKKRL
jgi:transposase